jgi:hypothetical protein
MSAVTPGLIGGCYRFLWQMLVNMSVKYLKAAVETTSGADAPKGVLKVRLGVQTMAVTSNSTLGAAYNG